MFAGILAVDGDHSGGCRESGSIGLRRGIVPVQVSNSDAINEQYQLVVSSDCQVLVSTFRRNRYIHGFMAK